MKRRVVVITGGSAGVGRATARLFAAEGCAVGLIARGRDGLEAAKRDVEAAGGRAAVAQADVADAAALEEAAKRLEEELGAIDVWINDAMVSVLSPVKELKPEEIRRVTEVTYLGTVNGTMCALKRMLPRNEGVIVQVGSALAYRGIPLQAAYCAAKHAVQGFTESLRCELLHDKSEVRVTMVQLPALNTPQFEWIKSRVGGQPAPVPPIFQPEVAARAILWAASHPRREINVGRSTTLAVVANNVAPGLLDRILARRAYKAQVRDEPPPPDRRDNLWEPVPGDHGAHGLFDTEAVESSAQLWITKHRWAFLPAALAVWAMTKARWPRTRR